jgi:AsmA protein
MQGSSANPQSVPFTKRVWVRVLGAIVVVLILVAIIVPFLVNADTFRPKVQSELSKALGRQVTLGHLSFSIFSGSLVADNITIADDPAFSNSPFFAAKSLHIGVNTSELLFHRQVQITDITADSPEVHLISGENSAWNYSSLGRNSNSNSQSSNSSSNSNLSIGELKIKDGSVSVASLSSKAKPFVYDKVDLTVKNVSYTTPMPFELTASLPGSGTLQLSGTAGPVAQPNVVNTPLEATLNVKHFDPVAAGVVEPGQGISMIADIDGRVKSDGKGASVSGKVQAANLKLSPNGTPAPHPVDVDLNVTDDLGTNSGRISDIAVHTGSLATHINGTYQVTGTNANLNLHVTAPNLPIDGLIELLPALGVRLPSGSSLRGGTLTANLAVTGPAASPRIAGPVQVDNTQLAGFDLGSKIEGVMKQGASPTSGGTAIHTLRADVVNTAQGTELSNIFGDVPSIGTASGGGTVAASGALNFQMLAKLSLPGATASTPAAAAPSGASWLGAVTGALHTTASNGIPLIIAGTTSSPSIRLDTTAMLKQQAGSLLNGKGTTNSNSKGSLTDLGKSLFGGHK